MSDIKNAPNMDELFSALEDVQKVGNGKPDTIYNPYYGWIMVDGILTQNGAELLSTLKNYEIKKRD